MCGITGAFHASNYKPKVGTINTALGYYGAQKSRGSDGFGAVTIMPDMDTRLFRATESTGIIVDLKLHKLMQGHEPIGILFHHRWPTSTDNTLKQTHPFKVSHKDLKHDYYVVHNGVISNDTEIKALHDKQGYKYTSLTEDNEWNDSETCSIEFAQAIENRDHKIRTLGSQAMVAIACDKVTGKALKVYLTTNGGNPMKYWHSNSVFVFASELNGTAIKDNELLTYTIGTNKVTHGKIQFVKPKPVIVPAYTPVKYDWKPSPSNTPVYSTNKAKQDWGKSTLNSRPLETKASQPLDPHATELQDIYAQIDEYMTYIEDPNFTATVEPEAYVEPILKLMQKIKEKESKAQQIDALLTA